MTKDKRWAFVHHKENDANWTPGLRDIFEYYVLNGWATFEYEGQGQRTIRKGDTVLQTPMIKHREIACSDDFEVLEIVSPANFKTRVVEPPESSGDVS